MKKRLAHKIYFNWKMDYWKFENRVSGSKCDVRIILAMFKLYKFIGHNHISISDAAKQYKDQYKSGLMIQPY